MLFMFLIISEFMGALNVYRGFLVNPPGYNLYYAGIKLQFTADHATNGPGFAFRVVGLIPSPSYGINSIKAINYSWGGGLYLY